MLPEDRFASITALIAEPSRARMLWNLLDGRALTATELATAANVSPQSASNHLAKLTEANLLVAEHQGRHRYYRFARPEVAYVIESIANLIAPVQPFHQPERVAQEIRYARSCYDHLAGQVAIELMKTFIQAEFVRETGQKSIQVTDRGWEWFATLGIEQEEMKKTSRRLLARTCLDWTERKPHLAGALGAELLKKFIELGWIRRKTNSRVVILTNIGRAQLHQQLGVLL